MGGKQSLMDTKLNIMLQSKEAYKMHYKCLREEEEERQKIKVAIESNNSEAARLHASNSIRKRDEAIRYLEFKSRLDIISAQLESAMRTQKVTDELKKALPQLNDLLKYKKLDSIEVINDFQKIFENMGKRDSHINKMISSDLLYNAPARDVDILISKVADEYALDATDVLKTPASNNNTSCENNKEANLS
ncbi:uncharacterized protein TOT_010000354 [Theileria orientalis strain Shintoku]|uniref:Uncharacterized protein n=1 Tax=Theileria orientalis strain Shintoku TaxID=869250 RepID=J4CC72_THEOR|nr:uncharacterized protein TOT_010000354 [Theileria orientalis strain Shintoku]PVC52684.1 hypothetical protein MACL_00000597 [Theileria orientalis]BAM38887.1 uncharacterized protein TOT_010000354 [Theileria orientalis strain Shintoku]|eukprot:XP_009689188.1 uncharacterized protein TOT_010000354 [Theileria orientalis strain Shintoku]